MQLNSGKQISMDNMADFSEEIAQDGDLKLKLSGQLTICHIGGFDERLRGLDGQVKQIDISDIGPIDTVGAWLIFRTAQINDAQIVGENAEASRLISELSENPVNDVAPSFKQDPASRIFSEIGEAIVSVFQTMLNFTSFVGQVIIALLTVIIHPSRLRVNAIIQRFDMVGVRALSIVGLMSFLIGVVVAQQGAVQLRQFGAEVFTVNLVGRLTFRELGVLMSAIMIAGRSGSSFAAQIGTMKITEEIDAMRVIGVSPIEALVLPRVFATVIMMPLVGFYACLMSIIGAGLLTWIVLDMPPVTFTDRIREVTPITDLYIAMIKAPVFGAIIALAGCFQGMQVKNNAEEVGFKTTAAVVQAIFLVIVLDAFFAIFFTEIGW